MGHWTIDLNHFPSKGASASLPEMGRYSWEAGHFEGARFSRKAEARPSDRCP
jgi:hypothetical protein